MRLSWSAAMFVPSFSHSIIRRTTKTALPRSSTFGRWVVVMMSSRTRGWMSNFAPSSPIRPASETPSTLIQVTVAVSLKGKHSSTEATSFSRKLPPS
jgi:hypothetical protein